MRRVRVLALLVLAAILAGCGSEWPRPVPEPRTRTFYPLLIGGPAKLGLAGCPASCERFGCTWCYSWSAQPSAPAGVEAVPMIWDETQVTSDVGGSSEWIMGFNEPDLGSQANLSPEQAVEPWAVVEARFPDRKLVAPAPSHLHPEWLPAFREAFRVRYGRAPRFAALAAHCYWSTAAGCAQMLDRYEGWARAWGVPEIWVTEFWFSNESEGRAWATELERRPLVSRWAPYVVYKPCTGGDPNWDCARHGNPSMLAADRMTPTQMGLWYARQTPGF